MTPPPPDPRAGDRRDASTSSGAPRRGVPSGTYVELRTTPDAVEAATDLAARVLDEVDLACSRFRDDSDLMRANAAAGAAPSRSPPCSSARCGWPSRPPPRPTAWSTRCSATCCAPPATTAPSPSCPPTTRPRPPCRCPRRRWAQVVVTDTTVTVPRGAALDLGATGKAFAADLVALCVADTLGVPVLVVRRRRPPGRRARATSCRTSRSWSATAVADLEAGGASALVRLAARRARHLERLGPALAPRRPPVAPRRRPPHRPARARARGAPSPPSAAPAAAANAATTASIVLGDGRVRLARHPQRRGPARRPRRPRDPHPRLDRIRHRGDLMTSPLLWYLNRGTGVVLLVVFTATVVLGVLATGRSADPALAALRHPGPAPRAGRAVGVHAGRPRGQRGRRLRTSTSAGGRPSCRSGRPTSRCGWRSAPSRSTCSPWSSPPPSPAPGSPTGSGSLVHLTTYAAWASAVVHGLFIGTDSERGLDGGHQLACVAAVGLAGARPGRRRARTARRRNHGYAQQRGPRRPYGPAVRRRARRPARPPNAGPAPEAEVAHDPPTGQRRRAQRAAPAVRHRPRPGLAAHRARLGRPARARRRALVAAAR